MKTCLSHSNALVLSLWVLFAWVATMGANFSNESSFLSDLISQYAEHRQGYTQHPQWYCFKVRCFVLFGFAIPWLILALGLVGSGCLVWVLIDLAQNTNGYVSPWKGVMGILGAFIFGLCLEQSLKLWNIPLSPLTGIKIPERQGEFLTAHIEALSQQLHLHPSPILYLTLDYRLQWIDPIPSFFQAPWWNPPRQGILALGYPILQTLSPDHAKAYITLKLFQKMGLAHSHHRPFLYWERLWLTFEESFQKNVGIINLLRYFYGWYFSKLHCYLHPILDEGETQAFQAAIKAEGNYTVPESDDAVSYFGSIVFPDFEDKLKSLQKVFPTLPNNYLEQWKQRIKEPLDTHSVFRFFHDTKTEPSMAETGGPWQFISSTSSMSFPNHFINLFPCSEPAYESLMPKHHQTFESQLNTLWQTSKSEQWHHEYQEHQLHLMRLLELEREPSIQTILSNLEASTTPYDREQEVAKTPPPDGSPLTSSGQCASHLIIEYAQLLRKVRQEDELALQVLEWAVQHEPPNGLLQYTLAETLFEINPDASVPYFHRAVSYDYLLTYKAYCHLYDHYLIQGEYSKIDFYAEALLTFEKQYDLLLHRASRLNIQNNLFEPNPLSPVTLYELQQALEKYPQIKDIFMVGQTIDGPPEARFRIILLHWPVSPLQWPPSNEVQLSMVDALIQSLSLPHDLLILCETNSRRYSRWVQHCHKHNRGQQLPLTPQFPFKSPTSNTQTVDEKTESPNPPIEPKE